MATCGLLWLPVVYYGYTCSLYYCYTYSFPSVLPSLLYTAICTAYLACPCYSLLCLPRGVRHLRFRQRDLEFFGFLAWFQDSWLHSGDSCSPNKESICHLISNIRKVTTNDSKILKFTDNLAICISWDSYRFRKPSTRFRIVSDPSAYP